MPTHALARLRREWPMGEAEIAAASVVLTLTATVGCMVVAFLAVQGQLSLLAVPTAALLVSMARHETVTSAWWALGTWTFLLPMALSMGVVAPLLMMVVCLALAIGPDRVTDWVVERLRVKPPPPDPASEPEAVGWIEDDPRFSE